MQTSVISEPQIHGRQVDNTAIHWSARLRLAFQSSILFLHNQSHHVNLWQNVVGPLPRLNCRHSFTGSALRLSRGQKCSELHLDLLLWSHIMMKWADYCAIIARGFRCAATSDNLTRQWHTRTTTFVWMKPKGVLYKPLIQKFAITIWQHNNTQMHHLGLAGHKSAHTLAEDGLMRKLVGDQTIRTSSIWN